jgi:hypothetical protein
MKIAVAVITLYRMPREGLKTTLFHNVLHLFKIRCGKPFNNQLDVGRSQ